MSDTGGYSFRSGYSLPARALTMRPRPRLATGWEDGCLQPVDNGHRDIDQHKVGLQSGYKFKGVGAGVTNSNDVNIFG